VSLVNETKGQRGEKNRDAAAAKSKNYASQGLEDRLLKGGKKELQIQSREKGQES